MSRATKRMSNVIYKTAASDLLVVDGEAAICGLQQRTVDKPNVP